MPDEQSTVPVAEHCGPGPKVAAWVLGALFLVSTGLAAFLWVRIGIADQQINALNASVQRLDNEKAALELTIDAMEDEQAMMEEEAMGEEVSKSEPPEGWVRYTDPAGRFSFDHPEEVLAGCNEDGSCLLTWPTEDNPEPVPDMRINITDTSVEISTWENFDIPYFEALVSSFQFVQQVEE